MRYRDLNEDELREVKLYVLSHTKDMLESMIHKTVLEHTKKCKKCGDTVHQSNKKMVEEVFSQKCRNISDEMITKVYNHAGVKIPKHCYVNSECSCIYHEMNENHCCNCEPDKCIKRKGSDWKTLSVFCGICKKKFDSEQEYNNHDCMKNNIAS